MMMVLPGRAMQGPGGRVRYMKNEGMNSEKYSSLKMAVGFKIDLYKEKCQDKLFIDDAIEHPASGVTNFGHHVNICGRRTSSSAWTTGMYRSSWWKPRLRLVSRYGHSELNRRESDLRATPTECWRYLWIDAAEKRHASLLLVQKIHFCLCCKNHVKKFLLSLICFVCEIRL